MRRLLDRVLRSEWAYAWLVAWPYVPPRSRLGRWLHETRERCHALRLGHCGTGGYLQDTLVYHPQRVMIGDRVTFGGRVLIYGQGGVTIGNDCMIAYGVVIHTATHDPRAARLNAAVHTAPVRIGNNVWIGAGAMLLPGVSLADGTVVGAGAVVRQPVCEPDQLVVGVPARVHGCRRPDETPAAEECTVGAGGGRR